MDSWSRRRLLRLFPGIVALAGIAALPGCGDDDDEDDDEDDDAGDLPVARGGAPGDTIVIGAGVSGLAAAKAIAKAGGKVVVLEGRNRIGGRIWTERGFAPVPIELGASWIHGPKGNSLADFAKSLGMKFVLSDDDSRAYYGPDGKPLSREAVRRLDKRYAALESRIEKLREIRMDEDEPDISLQEGINMVLAGDNLDASARREIDFLVNAYLESEYAADASSLSLYHWDDDAEDRGGDALLPDGYDRVVNALSEGLDIRLSEPVQRIEHGPDGVRVVTQSGLFTADRAVVTLPLGVLKSGAVEFSPGLSGERRAALGHLGMDVLDKLYLKFPRAFWPDKTEYINYIDASQPAWSEALDYHTLFGQPILLWFNSGSFARALEARSDADVVASAMQAMRLMFGKDAPDPVAAVVTRWSKDPFALGSYSHVKVGGSAADRAALARPEGDRLFFAGEHTDRDHSSTVSGAYRSGLRAAAEVLG